MVKWTDDIIMALIPWVISHWEENGVKGITKHLLFSCGFNGQRGEITGGFGMSANSPENSSQKLIAGFQAVYHWGLPLKGIHLSEVRGLSILFVLPGRVRSITEGISG